MVEESPAGATIVTDSPSIEVTPWHSEEQREFVETKGWKEGSAAVQSYIDLEKSQGGRVKIPTDQSSKDELEAFYRSTGRPDAPEGYEIKDVPENVSRDEASENALRAKAFEIGCPKQIFEALFKTFYQELGERLSASKTEGEALLRQEEGWETQEGYDKNVEIATRACNELGGEDFMKALDQTGFGNLPAFIKTFYNIGVKMLDDTIIKGSPSGETKADSEYKPRWIKSPEMYEHGDDDESTKARDYFKKQGHVYNN